MARNTVRKKSLNSKTVQSGIDAIMPSCESYQLHLKWQGLRCTNGGILTQWREAVVIFTIYILSFFLVPEKIFGMVLKH
jgi:hypothetical protein